MPITHTKVSAVADGGDTTLVRPVDWNAAHVIEVDYVEFTGSASPSGTTAATATTIVTGSSIAYDGSTVVLIEFFCPQAQPAAIGNAQLLFELFDGATDLGIIGIVRSSGSTTGAATYAARRLTPSNASHSYVIKAWVSSGTGTVGAGAGGTETLLPGFIRITKV